jgi:predicted component of type VI protein secretion system
MRTYIIPVVVLMLLTVIICVAITACGSAKPAKPARVNITHTEVYHITDAKGQKCVLTVNPVPVPETFTCTNA